MEDFDGLQGVQGLEGWRTSTACRVFRAWRVGGLEDFGGGEDRTAGRLSGLARCPEEPVRIRGQGRCPGCSVETALRGNRGGPPFRPGPVAAV